MALIPPEQQRLPRIRFLQPRPDALVATGTGRAGQVNPISAAQGLVIAVAVTAPVGILPVRPGPVAAPTAPPAPNPNFPTFTFTYDLPLITPSGAVIPAGTNLAALFQFAGSTGLADGFLEETTFVWFVGGSVPREARTLTMTARIADMFGRQAAGETSLTVELVPIAGAGWTSPPGEAQ